MRRAPRQRLEALPGPRSPRGRACPLACLAAIAVGAFTAAGNDRFTAAGQWISRASRTGRGPVNLATIRAAITAALNQADNLHIPEGRRDHATPAETLRLHGLDQDKCRHSRNTPEP